MNHFFGRYTQNALQVAGHMTWEKLWYLLITNTGFNFLAVPGPAHKFGCQKKKEKKKRQLATTNVMTKLGGNMTSQKVASTCEKEDDVANSKDVLHVCRRECVLVWVQQFWGGPVHWTMSGAQPASSRFTTTVQWIFYFLFSPISLYSMFFCSFIYMMSKDKLTADTHDRIQILKSKNY